MATVRETVEEKRKKNKNNEEEKKASLSVRESVEQKRNSSLSTNNTNKTPTFDYETGKKGWQKYLDDQSSAEQKKTEEKEDEKWWETLGRYLGSTGATDTTLPLGNTGQIINDVRNDTSYQRPSDDWSEDQQYQFGALYLESPGKAYAYAEKINNENNKAKEAAEIEKIQKSATSSDGGKFGHTLGAIATAPLGMADYLNMLVMANAGRDPSASDGIVSPFEYSQAVTEGVATDLNNAYGTLDENIPIIGGKGWGDVYGLGTSIAQSAVSGYTLGPVGTLVSYFGQGAASGMKDALERGATESQAALYGAALGAFEGIAEQIGIDNLFKLGSASTIKGLLKNMLKQAGAEGMEEGLTSIFSNIADNVIMQDKSNFYAMVAEYMKLGMSEEEAKKKAWMDSVEGITYDTIAGAVSGGVHGGASTTIQTGISNYNTNKHFGNQAQGIVNDALNSPHANVQAIGQKYQEKLNGGKKLSGWNLNELIEVTDTDKIKNAALQRLGELGETSDVTAVADVLVKQALGEELSSRDQKILNQSKYGNVVATELNKDNIKSGGLANNWAAEIGTRKANPEVYNKAKIDAANELVSETIPKESKYNTSESGKTTLNDQEVSIQGVESIKGGEVTVRLESGETVNASDLKFSDKEALMYDIISRMDATPDTANKILSEVKPVSVAQASMYYNSIPLAYEYGKINYEAGLKNINLPKALKQNVYTRGRIDAMIQAEAKTPKTNVAQKGSNKTKSGIIYEDGFVYDEASANEMQRVSMAHIEVINKMSNLEVHVFESKVENGKRVAYVNGKLVSAPNGYFKDGNKIYIDFNAGNKGEGAMLYTMSHEITHYIREWNAKGFKELGDFLIEQYGKKGVNVEYLLEQQRKKIKKRYAAEGKALPSEAKLNDMAYEEMVADAMSDMLADPKAYEKLAKLKQQNKTLWEKVGEAIKAVLDKLKAALGVYKGKDVATEAARVRDFSSDVYEKLQDLYIKAFVEADANYADAELAKSMPEVIERITNEIVKPSETASDPDTRYSLRGINEDGIEVYETSEEIKKLPIKERQKVFLDIMKNEYRGRTAKFIRNGHAYYASFDYRDVNKNIYGDKLSDKKGWKAKINVGAEGEIFHLVENAKYDGSKHESGKNIDAHKGVGYWDYFIKMVQIDNTVFDLIANVRKKTDGEFVYSIQLNKNKEKEASPSLGSPNGVLNRMLNASEDSISHNSDFVNREFSEDQKNSDRDTETISNRTLLANALDSIAKNDIEKNRLAQYREKIALIESEQAKLSKIRAELRELYFTKGRRDTDKIKSLQFEATQIENRINAYDRQLLKLESTEALKGVLDREKKMAYKKAEQRGKESLRRQKEKDAETVRTLLAHHRESRMKSIEGRNKTAMRAKIKKVVSELNQLLLHGSKERNVKLGLQEAVAAALDAINMDTVGADERIAKYNALIAKATDEDVIASLVETRDRIKAQGDSLGDKLKAMKEAYYAIQHGEESKNYPAYFKDEATLIEQRIQNVIDKVGNTSLRNMSLAQLDLVYDMYKMVLTTIRNANNVWKEGKALDLQENASAVMTELEAIKELGEEGTKIGEHIRYYSWNEMTPYYAFDRIGSKTFKSFFMETIRGQNVYARDVAEAKAFADKTRKKYGYTKWDLDKVYEFKLKDTRKFQVTLKHMLSIYAYSKREQALPHMSTGGFFFNDKSTFRKKGGIIELIRRTDSGYKIDAEILAEIKEALGDKVNYVDEMQDYLTKMGEKGNEVTRTLWGIDLFKEKVYFPLKSMSDFIKKSTETAQSVSLKNDGMTKETVPGASNPIVLEAFDDVWASHIDRMSQYHAFVIPIDNLNKIHQYGTWAGTESMAVSTMLTGRFGSAVNEYITQFIKDLNGNVVNPGAKNPLMGFLSKFKKTAVGASLSTVVQQPTAVLRAMADINAKYFIGKPNTKKLSNQWEELKQYAPIAIIKDIGGFDAGSGVQVSNWLNSDTLRGVDKVMNTIDDISMKGAEIADQLGWTSIWEAVKREISATTNLKVGSEEFLKKAGERFTEVIVRTQVYDSTLSRSGFMRSKSDTMKMLTAFMGEPTLSINMMFNAIINAKRGGSKKQAVRTIGFTYASIIAASALSSLIYALRDDDDDESYLEKYMESLGGEFISDVVLAPVTSLPAVKDIVSIFQGWDVERTDVAIFKDIKDAFDGLSSETKSPYRKVEDFAGAIASAFGLPLKNVLRTGREIYNAFSAITDDISGGDAGGAFIEGITGKGQSKPSQLYKVIINGDDARLERIKSSYKDESSYLNAVKTALRENDSRINEAAQARLDGNISEYTRIAREIIAEGHFSQDTVVAAINAEMNAIKKAQSEPTESTDDKDEVTSIYKADDFNVAFDNGDKALALSIIDELVEMKVANGMDETKAKSSLRSSMTSYWKPLYIAASESGNTSEMQRIKQILYYSGLYGSAADVVKAVKSWTK
jgi:hypothetical protein